MPKFIRAEYYGHGPHKMNYFWECERCGQEYRTTLLPQTGYCRQCKELVAKERLAQAKANTEARALKSVCDKIKKKLDYKTLPSITVNGTKYLSEEAVKETIESIINDN